MRGLHGRDPAGVAGFTFEGLNLPERGLAYNADADRRSWRAMQDFWPNVCRSEAFEGNERDVRALDCKGR